MKEPGIKWGALVCGVIWAALAGFRWGLYPAIDVAALLMCGWRLGEFFDSVDDSQ